jgi:DMSO/TMAO reductase YedYZ heme-binding membrane subunit
MPFVKWHRQTIKKIPKVETDLQRYVKVTTLSLVVFGASYGYLSWMGIPGTVNKAVADTSVIFICLSMLLSSICYFWNFADTKIVYRKHLGLVGFGYAVVHLLLSLPALKQLTNPQAWQSGAVYPVLAATVATIIFTVMALISNNYAAKELGGIWWRRILRTGYLGLIFALAHVALLKMSRWVTWWQEGTSRPPALSLIVSVLIVITLVSRLILEVSLRRKTAKLTAKR